MGTYFTLFLRAAGGFLEDNCMSFAAAISYYALFSLFPLLIFIISMLGFFIHSDSQRASVVNALFQLLGQGVAKNALYTQVNAVAGGRGGLGLVGLVVALWSASSVFGAIRTGLNAAWDVTRSRPLVPAKLLDLAMVIGVGALMLLSLAATGILTAIEGFSYYLFGNAIGPVARILFAVLFLAVPPAISFLAFSLTYYIVPHTKVHGRDVWLGAFVAAVLFQLIQIGFGVYVANLAHYSRVYGSLGAVIAFLFFMYISANILLFGGEVAKEYADLRAGVRPGAQPEAPGAEESLADRVGGLVKGLFVDQSAHRDGTSSGGARDVTRR